jgi:hypothetical protein
MMTEVTKKRKIDWHVIKYWSVTLSFIVGLIYINKIYNEQQSKRQYEWQQIACPSLLSISRSSRDTLIIMKSEPLCSTYLLDNLK